MALAVGALGHGSFRDLYNTIKLTCETFISKGGFVFHKSRQISTKAINKGMEACKPYDSQTQDKAGTKSLSPSQDFKNPDLTPLL